MNNKYTRILLFSAVILVWGLILFKIISFFSMKKEESQASFIKTQKNINITVLPDTFNLLLNYQDPFLSIYNVNNSNKRVKHIVSNVQKKVHEPALILPMPEVKYFGLVMNRETKKLVAIINISGKQYLAKQSEVIDNITMLKMEKDSIFIAHGKTKKWIHK